MGWLTKIGIAAFISANAKIFFRLSISVSIIFILNLLYNKYEALLLATSPEKLFIPLYIFTFSTIALIIWTLLSFKWFSSFKKSKEVVEIKKSFHNMPEEYKKISDVSQYPSLRKINTDKY
jgi:hypothetical protein